MTRRSTVCRAAWGHVAGYGFTGRGYAIFQDGVQVTGVHASPALAWAAHRRTRAAAGGAR